ncbi:hypothetical protein [Streptomyces sp. NPDC058664]|uniref:hypothetical protein n=1 Tax=unclassified Streptomyces TaxID=2593676 RepID=UPI0036649D94
MVMTLGEKLEQAVTGRPDSHVPARVLERLMGTAERPRRQPVPVHWAMHYGQVALLGVLRSGMAHSGLRGPAASARFAVVRLTNDQVLENPTGVGAPPQTRPRKELLVDLLHKAVYATATGIVADALAARSGPGPGRRHAARRAGRHADVGPLPHGNRCRASAVVAGVPRARARDHTGCAQCARRSAAAPARQAAKAAAAGAAAVHQPRERKGVDRSRMRSKALSGTPARALPGGRRDTAGWGRVGAVRRTVSQAESSRRSRALSCSSASCRRGSSTSSSSRMSSRIRAKAAATS